MAKQDVTVELFYSSQWNDITDDVRIGAGITISRGQPDEGQALRPSTADLVINNGVSNVDPSVTGRYSRRNPNSDLYGLIGRNTPLRIFLGTPHLSDGNVDLVDTTDHVAPSLDAPTSDGLLICAWGTPDPGDGYTLPGSMTAGPSTTDARTTLDSAYEVISASGATGTRTATYDTTEDYLAASVLLHGTSIGVALTGGFSVDLPGIGATAGNWWVVVSYFGWDTTEATATPDFPGDTDGGGWMLLTDSGTFFVGDAEADYFRMKVWVKEVKTSATHTVWVDNPTGDLDSIQSVFYELSNVGSWSMRLVGEVAKWPPRWVVGDGNAWVSIQVAGITRRLGRLRTTSASALARYIPRTNPAGYWPMEGRTLSGFPSGLDGGPIMRYTIGGSKSAAIDGPLGSSQLPDWKQSLFEDFSLALGRVTGNTGTTSWTTVGWFRMVHDGSSTFAGSVYEVLTTGTIATWQIGTRFNSGTFVSELTVLKRDGSGSQVGGLHLFTIDVMDGNWYLITFQATQSGSDIDFELFVNGTSAGTDSATSETLGRVSNLRRRTDFDPVQSVGVGHLAAFAGTSVDQGTLVRVGGGWQGETPSERIARILREEGIQHAIIGDTDAEEVLLGAQYPDRWLNVVKEAAAAGRGWLFEAREFRGYVYRTPGNAYNRSAVLALDHSTGGIGPPLEPTEDDKGVVNDITVTRRDGASVRRVQESGPLNVSDPEDDPDGIGVVDAPVTVSLSSDALLGNQAGWRLLLGTVDEYRWPAVTVDLDAVPSLAAGAGRMDVADRFTIDNLPAWLPPDQVTQLGLGYSEAIGSHRRTISISATPESPYHIADWDDTQLGAAQNGSIAQSDSATLDEALDTTETAVDIDCGAGPDWDHEVDFDILVGGERMTVTAVGSMSGTFPARKVTLTVTRSVNGVVKTHSSGDRVEPFHKRYIGL